MKRSLPPAFLLACRRQSVALTRHVCVVSVSRQEVRWFTADAGLSMNLPVDGPPAGPAGSGCAASRALRPGTGRGPAGSGSQRAVREPWTLPMNRRFNHEEHEGHEEDRGKTPRDSSGLRGFRDRDELLSGPKSVRSPETKRRLHTLRRRFVASTSRFGIGQVRDTNRTPLGLHRIARKVGAGWPVGTVFRARQPIGYTWRGLPTATIAHRILWLDGLEPGFNRGGDVDTFGRYIYIHGLAEEPTLGRPASHGCIHLAASDLMPLFDRLPVGTLVWIHR